MKILAGAYGTFPTSVQQLDGKVAELKLQLIS